MSENIVSWKEKNVLKEKHFNYVEGRILKCQRQLKRNESDCSRVWLAQELRARAVRRLKGTERGQLVLRYVVDIWERRVYSHGQKSWNKNRNK